MSISVGKQADSGLNSEERSTLALRGLQVLLVEDEVDMAALLLFVLEELGAKVVLVASASEALQQLKQRLPDLLLSDIQMTGDDGLWLIRQLRSSGIGRQELPAIAMTSYTREVSCNRVLEAGFQSFLTKPIDAQALAVQVLTLTGRA